MVVMPDLSPPEGYILRAADMEPVGVELEALRRVEKERDELAAKWEAAMTEGDALFMRILTHCKERDLPRAELASARIELEQRRVERNKAYAANNDLIDELERLRPIVAAARAYVTHPERPETSDPNEAHLWDLEAERRYYALAELINTTTEGAPPA